MTPPLVNSPLSKLMPAFVLIKYNVGPTILSATTAAAAVSAVAVNAAANETPKTASKNLSVSLTDKGSNDTLLEYPTGAYTGMRTSDYRGIMDFSCHVVRIADSLSQIQFSAAAAATMDKECSGQERKEEGQGEEQNNKEEPDVVNALAQFRNAETLKPMMTDLVREGLRNYYSQALEESSMGEAKVTVLCTWDSKVRKHRSYIIVARIKLMYMY